MSTYKAIIKTQPDSKFVSAYIVRVDGDGEEQVDCKFGWMTYSSKEMAQKKTAAYIKTI